MRGLSAYYFVKADLSRADEVGGELLPIANPSDPSEVMDGHYIVGLVDTFKGNFESGRVHLERAVALDYPERDRSSMFLTGLDVGVISCCIAAMPNWALGYADRALAHATRAIELAEAIKHPLSLTCAHYHAALIHIFRREREDARRQAAETMRLAGELGFFFDKIGEILLGWTEEGGPDVSANGDPLDRMRDALEAYLSTGSCAAHTFYMALIAEVCLGRGDLKGAEKYLTRALEQAEATGERYWEAELHRLMGEVALRDESRPKGRAEAERHHLRALEVARSQRAVPLEVRAALGLARMWVSDGRIHEARTLIEPALAAVQEGTDLPDPTAARELLASLDAASSSAVI